MSLKSNVIDMTARRQAQLKVEKGFKKAVGLEMESHPAKVEQLSEARDEVLRRERRKNRRTILSNFIGAFVVVPEKGLQPVALYDVSSEGLAFDTEAEHGKFRQSEKLALRVYMSRDSYFTFNIEVKNLREEKTEGVYRHGAAFVKQGADGEVLRTFVKFVEAVSTVLRRDSGDHIINHNRG